MCRAFGCIIHKSGKVYWKCGIDSHSGIFKEFKLDSDNKKGDYCQIEILPDNGDYIFSDNWILVFDEEGCPGWWKISHEKHCFEALEKWKKEVYSIVDRDKIKNLIDPFNDCPMVKKVNKSQIELLKQWIDIQDKRVDAILHSIKSPTTIQHSIRTSIRDSIGDSVEESVWNSMEHILKYSVDDYTDDFVFGYVGAMFHLKRNEWKNTDNIKSKDYPFIPVVKLWEQGLFCSFERPNWNLHSGKYAEIVFR